MQNRWNVEQETKLSSGIQKQWRYLVMPVHTPERNGILKVATDQATTKALSREILAGLSVPYLTSKVRVPKILAIGKYESRLCFIAERIEGKPLGSVGHEHWCDDSCVETATSAVLELAKLRDHPLMRIIRSVTPVNRYDTSGKLRYYQSVLPSIAKTDPQIAERLSFLLCRASQNCTYFLPSMNHGDLTLWHIYPCDDGVPCLIDWENWSPSNNVLGWDLAHLYARTRQFHGKEPYCKDIARRVIERIRIYCPEYADIVQKSFPILTLFATTSLARETSLNSVRYDTSVARRNLVLMVDDIEHGTLLS